LLDTNARGLHQIVKEFAVSKTSDFSDSQPVAASEIVVFEEPVKELLEAFRTQNKLLEPFSEPIYWTKALNPIKEDFIARLERIFKNHHYSNFGEQHQELEQKLRDYLGVKTCILVNNATIGLMLALKAAEKLSEVKSKKVITTAFTFPATVQAIKFLGFEPVFADICPFSLCLDPENVERTIKKYGVPFAALPVHVFGNVCDLEAFNYLKQKHGFVLIYDAAHVFGTKVKGHGIGCFGDISVFSLHATKILHTAEGGILTSDSVDYETLHILRNNGFAGVDLVKGLGINAKLSEMNCALGLSIFPLIDEAIKKRKKLYELYQAILKPVDFLEPLLRVSSDVSPSYMYCPYAISSKSGISREALIERLKKYKVVIRRYFYPLLSKVDCYLDAAGADELPVSEDIVQRSFVLPLNSYMEIDDVVKICELLKLELTTLRNGVTARQAVINPEI